MTPVEVALDVPAERFDPYFGVEVRGQVERDRAAQVLEIELGPGGGVPFEVDLAGHRRALHGRELPARDLEPAACRARLDLTARLRDLDRPAVDSGRCRLGDIDVAPDRLVAAGLDGKGSVQLERHGDIGIELVVTGPILPSPCSTGLRRIVRSLAAFREPPFIPVIPVGEIGAEAHDL